MIIKQIKIICIDQPLRFRTKNLIIPAGILIIKFVCAHFICGAFKRESTKNVPN